MISELNLQIVDPSLRPYVEDAFRDGSPAGFVYGAGGRHKELRLVADNVFSLKKRGIYEEALIIAYTGARTNHHKIPQRCLDFLFASADKRLLLEAGEAFPDLPEYQIYRGIAGHSCRRPRGYSWSLSLDVACWFALRFGLPKPEVLVAEIQRAKILAYSGDSEQEMICRPSKYSTLALTEAEIEERAARYRKVIKDSSAVLATPWPGPN